MMGYDLLADVRQKAGVEDVELILIWQVEIGGEGVGEDGDHLGMADAAVQGLHVQNLIQIPSDVILPVEALDGSIGHPKMLAIFAYTLATTFHLPAHDQLDILH